MIRVDLRSDTVTRPTPEMYEAMTRATLGDDVLGDDPTVQQLEALVAARLGKEAGLFVPSGTMGNQIALAVHCPRGEAAIFEEQAHMLYYEAGASAAVAGAVSFTVPSERGTMDPDHIERLVLRRSLHTPATAVICVENTHNRHSGAVVEMAALARYVEIGREHGVRLHMDGARVWHAAIRLGVAVSEIVAGFDSVSVCLSKGLRAPVGSVLCGSRDFVEEARRIRKRLGGGMRQAGVLAACGIVALNLYVDRLAQDHDRARRLAEGLDEIAGFQAHPERVETNIVVVDTQAPSEIVQRGLLELGVGCLPFGEKQIRLVTHADVDDDGIDFALEAMAKFAAKA